MYHTKVSTQKGTSNGDLEIDLKYLLFDFHLFHKCITIIITYCFSFVEHTQQDHIIVSVVIHCTV